MSGEDQSASKVGIDDLEKKKWAINVITLSLQGASDELDAAKQQVLIKFREIYPATYTTSRNSILAIVAFFVGTLFSLDNFLNIGSLKYIFLGIIIALFLLALIMFIIFNRGLSRVTKTLNSMDLAYQAAQGRLIMLRGSLFGWSLHPEELTVPRLLDLNNFFYIVIVNRVELVDAFNTAIKTPDLRREKKGLERLVQEMEKEMRVACKEYEENFSNSTDPKIKSLLFLIEVMIKRYGPAS